MTAITFDTLQFCKTLQDAGISTAQAEAIATAQKTALAQMVAASEAATKMDLVQLKMELTKEIQLAKQETVRWCLGSMVGLGALLTAVIAYVK